MGWMAPLRHLGAKVLVGRNRREFITLLGGAAATWPLTARAQQPAMPVIGYLSSFPADINPKFTQAFQQGLNEADFFEGRNVAIEYRWDEEGRYDRLPMMAADLVGRQVSVLFASPIPAALAAKAATATIPIVFAIGSDPVETGLVVSLNRPGGNVTGATFLSVALGAKRLELLRDLVPKITSVGLLVNPNNPNAAVQIKEMQEATTALALQLNVLRATSQSDFDNVFAMLVRQRTDALIVSADPFFLSHRAQLASELCVIRCPPSTMRASLLRRAVSSAMRPASPIHFVRRRPTSRDFSRARRRPIYRSCSRPSSSW